MVFRCHDHEAEIDVAIKCLPPELSSDAGEMEEVLRNFHLVHSLHHPNIAAVLGLRRDPENGEYFLIMECVEGITLQEWRFQAGDGPANLPPGRRTLAEVLPVLAQAAAALDHAHSQKIVHRDIKPSNIMLAADGKVKVLDFGLAAQIHTSLSRVNRAYCASGTAPYMAPEQWLGQVQGAATDQYALAVSAYLMLSGRLPFESQDAQALRAMALVSPPPRVPGLKRKTWKALERALAKDPSERFACCADFVKALGGATVSRRGPVLEHPVVLPSRRSGRGWLRRAALWLLLAAVAAGGVGLGLRAYRQHRKTRDVVDMGLVFVPPGSFKMGSTGGNPDEIPVHTVRISHGFWLGKYEVTQAQYEKVMGKNPSLFKGARNPVEEVSWYDAMAFCKKLTEQERSSGRLPAGYAYRLPTEAEWEYAARGGPKSQGYKYAGSSDLNEVGWYAGNSWGKTHPVGQKKPNELGLYDMPGNVWEWCLDWYDSGYYGKSAPVDPVNTAKTAVRVLRGNCWGSAGHDCRPANRYRGRPGLTSYGTGFRVCLAPDPS